jgi:CopA family copper-resistance protein
MDRSGFARGTLAPRAGMQGAVPPLDPRPLRTMADMGMGDMAGMTMDHSAMPGMQHGDGMPSSMPPMPGMDHSTMPGMNHGSMPGMGHMGAGTNMGGTDSAPKEGVEVDNVAMMPSGRLDDPGGGLADNGRRVLRYTDLRALKPGGDPRPPTREIVLHLTGNMQRFIWGFDGKKYSEAAPIQLARGERVRFVLINDSMMEHPIHLHGLWSELDNGGGNYRPYKHTILVKPGERVTYLVTADEPGRWAFHCHLLYHMELGMFREVHVA